MRSENGSSFHRANKELRPLWEALRIGGTFSGLNTVVCVFWACAGTVLAYLLTTPTAWRAFKTVMALALAASGGMIFL